MYRTFMRMALVLMLLTAGMGADAQNLKIGVAMDNGTAYDDGTTISTLASVATYTIEGADSIKSAEYKVEGPAGFTTLSGSLTFNASKASVSTGKLTVSGKYKCTVTVTYNGGTSESQSLDKTINVYSPSMVCDASSKQTYEVFPGNKTVKLVAAPQGEVPSSVPSGWTYQWCRNNTDIAGATAASYQLEGKDAAAGNTTYTLKYTYSVNGKEWVNKSLDYKVTVLSAPSVTCDPSGLLYEGIIGENASLGITRNGGSASGWTVKWSDGSTADKITPAITASQTYTVDVTNKCADDEWKDSRKFTVTGYVKPTVSVDKTSIETHTSAGKTVTASHTGGKAGAWSVSWKDGNTLLYTGDTFNTKDLKSGTHTITVEFTDNLAPKAWTEKKYVTVTVVDASATTTPADVSGTIYSYVGRSFEFGITHKGGQSWSYVWYDVKNSKKLDITSEHYNANKFTAAGDYKFREVATDKLANDTCSFDKTFNFTVYDTPALKRTSDEKITCNTSDNVKLSVEAAGGRPDGWTYVWTKNGIVQTQYNNRSSIDFNTENTQRTDITDTWICKATNAYKDASSDWSVSYEQTFSVTIHPQNRIVAPGGSTNVSISCYDNDKVDLNVIKQIAEGVKEGSWTITLTKDDGTTASLDAGKDTIGYSFTAVNKTRKDITGHYRIDAVNTLDGKTYPSGVEFTVKILATPQRDGIAINGVLKEIDSNNNVYLDTYDDHRDRIEIITSGGSSLNWSYSWKEGDESAGSSSFLLKRFSNTDTDPYLTKTYTVVAIYKDVLSKKEFRFPQDGVYTVNVRVYKKVSATDKTYDFYADGTPHTLNASDHITGGYPDGWAYNWNTGEKTQSIQAYRWLDTDADSTRLTYHLDAVNKYTNDSIWAEAQTDYVVNFWSTGYVAPGQFGDSFDKNCYEGVDKTITLNHQGGYDKGWTYDWYLNDMDKPKQSSGDSYTFTPVMDDKTVASEEHDFKVGYSNELNGVYGLPSASQACRLTYWPKPTVADEKNLIITDETRHSTGDKFIRTGNTLKLSANPAGGYSAGWEYSWTVQHEGGSTVKSSDKDYTEDVSFGTSDYRMGSKKITVKATMTDKKYDKTDWQFWQYEETIVVYNKPLTPKSLAKMGNTTTCIMAVTMPDPISDDNLSDYEYWLAFGYDDADGVSHFASARSQKGEEGTKRWVKLESGIFKIADAKLWVCSVWDYGNVQITSGKRYVNGTVDENWDGSGIINLSDYSTRAVIDADPTAIDGISADGVTVKAIYTPDGNVISTPQKGINIFRMSDGTTRKVLVK